MPEMYKRWRLHVFPVTHLHIASGEWLDPTQYVITGNQLHVLNQPRLIAYLNAKDPAKLKEMVGLGHNMIARFLCDSFDPSQTGTWVQRHPVEEAYQKQYLQDLDNPAAQQLVSSFIANRLTGNPYLPGSSIKGALRTALVAWRAKDPAARIRRLSSGEISERDLEPILFGYLNDWGRPNITLDPFKGLKVADCEFPMASLGLRKIEVRKKNPREESQRAHPGDELSYLAQVLVKGTPGLSTILAADRHWLGKFPIERMIASCNDFFRQKLREDDSFYLPERKKLHDNLAGWLANLKPNQFLLRLGKGTGSLHKSVNDPHPATRSLAGGMPLGICCCTLEELP